MTMILKRCLKPFVIKFFFFIDLKKFLWKTRARVSHIYRRWTEEAHLFICMSPYPFDCYLFPLPLYISLLNSHFPFLCMLYDGVLENAISRVLARLYVMVEGWHKFQLSIFAISFTIILCKIKALINFLVIICIFGEHGTLFSLDGINNFLKSDTCKII